MAQINHLVFDLGKVLIDFSYSQLFPFLKRRGALIQNIGDFAEQVALVDYEHGRLTTVDFLQGINNLLSAPLTEAEIQQVWCGIFTPIPQMLSLARRLNRQMNVYIISNTGEIHWQYLQQRFALAKLCKESFASFEVGQMKPAPEIYRTAETRFDLNPAETVFIDDRLENVSGAIACGWQGIHHQSYGQTCEALHELGINPTADI
ncbi:MAG: HAD family phosphatase [Geopsychrobacter sp.]|nr:HAD family phosphatase [Geopsychrobacter sp.]